MAYQTLYLKYRSQTFADLVGQDAIARTLQNAVQQARVAHAYLFSGMRGTGKTSTARILARAINCLSRRGPEPCGACAACVEIASGAAVDLVEIDAASNRGIDEIRELRERVKYLPASLRVKVYIIDEAHMLTPEAFNALLKTLEEPPAHVLFVLATTEPHKIPLTVASRCQRFDFRRIETEAIAARLAAIVQAEGVSVDPPALALLAGLAKGSMRDGISFLDQLLSLGEGAVTVERTVELLGLADPRVLVELLASAVAGEAPQTLGLLHRFYDAGGDVRQLVRGLLQAIREAVQLSVGYREGEGLGAGTGPRLEAIGRSAGREVLLDLWRGLMAMEPELRKGADAALLLEVTLLQNMGTAMAVAAPEGPSAATVPSPPPQAQPAAPAVARPELGADARWDALKQRLPRQVSSLLLDARIAAAGDTVVRIEFRYPAHLELMQKADKQELLLRVAREIFGPEVRLELATAEKVVSMPSSGPSPVPPAEDPVVRDAMNRFDVVNVRVTPKGR